MDPQETLISSIHKFQSQSNLVSNSTHPFASSTEENSNLLQNLVNNVDQLSNNLSLYQTVSWSNPKLISILRQHSSLAQALHASEKNVQRITESLRKRSGVRYGENIPIDLATIADFCVARLVAWGTSVGMETFKDDKPGGDVTVMLAGKVLVVDVDFSFNRQDALRPVVKVANVKTSYALSGNASGPALNGLMSLDVFLQTSIQAFCTEVQNDEYVRDPKEASRLGQAILEQLQYLVMLDKLAESRNDRGIKWFVDVDEFYPVLEGFSKNEAEVVASSLSVTHAPLDIFLLRAHALPLPYIIFPSISFLIFIPPQTYLNLIRSTPSPSRETSQKFPRLDIPLLHLSSYLAKKPTEATIATLRLTKLSDVSPLPSVLSMGSFTSRPTFPLVPHGLQLEHDFPQLADVSAMVIDELNNFVGHYSWILDFTNGGTQPGIIMSQSRMREMELVVNPFSGMDNIDTIGMVSFGVGSWLDLLLNPAANVFPERYTALYKSPTNRHPPLQLRLTVPEEPGFVLEKVPVHSVKEVLGILEVVREQAWLNGLFTGLHWTPEGSINHDDLPPDDDPTEEDLQSILAGTFVPRKIPVNVFIPMQNSTSDSLFGPPELGSMSISQPKRPRIVMTAPERHPISGLVDITVNYDETRPRGVSVELRGAIGADVKVETMEEICRRGGTLGLCGRVWARSHGAL